MTDAAGCASACAVSCRAWASGRSSTPPRPRWACPGPCATTAPAAIIEVEGDAATSTSPSRRLRETPRRWPSSNRLRHKISRSSAAPASRSPTPRDRTAAARWPPPTSPCAPTAPPNSATRPTGATGTRSSTAPTAAPASRSSPRCPTTVPPPRWRRSRCARLRPRIHRPRRPTVPRPARLLPELRTDAALPRRRRRRDRRRPMRCRKHGGCCATVASSRSRASADTTWPATPRTSRGRRAAPPKAARRQAVRRDGARPDDRAHHRRRRRAIRSAAVRPAAPDRADARRAGARRRCGRAAQPDLGVMLAYTPLHVLLFGLAGDDAGAAGAGDDVRAIWVVSRSASPTTMHSTGFRTSPTAG